MNASSPTDLLLDLVKLLKKHGPQKFRALAEVLRDPTQLATLGDALEALANQSARLPSESRRGGTPARSNLGAQLEALATTMPEKAALLRQLLDQLMKPEGMPLSELRAYARQAGLPPLKSGDRSRVVQAFIASLIPLDLSSLREHLEQLTAPPQDRERDLAKWSQIILNPELKAAHGS